MEDDHSDSFGGGNPNRNKPAGDVSGHTQSPDDISPADRATPRPRDDATGDGDDIWPADREQDPTAEYFGNITEDMIEKLEVKAENNSGGGSEDVIAGNERKQVIINPVLRESVSEWLHSLRGGSGESLPSPGHCSSLPHCTSRGGRRNGGPHPVYCLLPVASPARLAGEYRLPESRTGAVD